MPAIPDPTYLRQIALFEDLSLDDLAVMNGLMRQQIYPRYTRKLWTVGMKKAAYPSG